MPAATITGSHVTADLSDVRVGVERVTREYASMTVADLRTHLVTLGALLGWGDTKGGAFSRVVPPGARVVVKPNWVMHENEGPWGLEPLVTHHALVQAVVAELMRTALATVVVGDAPLQSCDLSRLHRETGLASWAEATCSTDSRFLGLRDFRRTRSTFVSGLLESAQDQVALDEYVLFDLGGDSLLEPVTDAAAPFRVTCYPPELMQRTHTRGRHQYLVARDVIDADLVINLPKLKTHRKAGITCALKNLVGINGNKEFLPHHRLGGGDVGGDCYPGNDPIKRTLERSLDIENTLKFRPARHLVHQVNRALFRLVKMKGDEIGVDGGWSGNDTVWRMCLDLNRILLYGVPDGSMHTKPQRRVLHLVDAVVAGHGNGPLAPEPLPLGLLLGSASAAATDWVGTRLLGYANERIPIVREAFRVSRWPLADVGAEQIALLGALGTGPAALVLGESRIGTGVRYPPGWRGAAESTSETVQDVQVRSSPTRISADG